MKQEIKTPLTSYVSAQEMRITYPDTFDAPSKEELDELKVGDSVKVSTGDERFWNTVTHIEGETITATVDNNLVLKSHGLTYGDTIQFQKHNIYSIYKD